MIQPRPRTIPEATVARLAVYLRALTTFAESGRSTVSSGELAEAAGVNPAGLRKDLSHLGPCGVRGVGYEVQTLRDRIARVLGVDSSRGQIAHAQAHHAAPAGDPEGLRFLVGRAQDLAGLVPPGGFDVAVSVAVLHWVPGPEHPAVLAGIARALRPGGVLRVDMGGRGQIEAARAVLDEVSRRHGGPASPWYFPDPAAYAPLLRSAGFEVRRARLLAQRRRFGDRAALAGWLRSQVLPAYLGGIPGPGREPFVEEAVREAARVLRRADGSYDQDYVRLDVLAERS